jgi:hypothetical protein
LTPKELRAGTKKVALGQKWFNIAHSIPSFPEIPQFFGGTEVLHGHPRSTVANFEEI